jgi:shikimate kinase
LLPTAAIAEYQHLASRWRLAGPALRDKRERSEKARNSRFRSEARISTVTGPEQRRRVFLIGFMGAGKTSVGNVLAQRLGWKFYDLDDLIENREQQSIAAIFANMGEAGFRRIETAVLMELLQQTRMDSGSIVALGGGAFVQPENRDALQTVGATTVLLTAPLEELQRRCQGSPDVRPLARDKSRFEQLFATRRETYSLAQFQVATEGKAVEQVAKEIEQLLREQLAIGK